ncbi:YceD family protein [Oceanobacillus alkalisoli]|uniref:YceD family protein n=1 Tax=Oceanobacillus alkalisoli TaxID=2925113 RepID=UPI001F120A33|nr:YceD family protein [Oceanobacillus alkalisoli]MCF3942533.1 YceD family protein [Oceanobacillus alkalisoli]
MKISVSQIQRENFKGPFEVEETVDVSELETMNNDIRRIGPAQVKVLFTMDQSEEIFASMTIKGEMILPCARTLVDVHYPYEITADEVFSTSPYVTEEDLENEIHPVKGEVLDLKPYIMENILLGIPFRVFSEESNPEGAAPKEGDGWSFVQEEEPKEETIDPRLKKLASLLENKDKKMNSE